MHERVRSALEDMVEYAEELRGFLAGKTLENVLDSRVLRLAMERSLEIVGEAAARIPDFARKEIPLEWREIVGLHNIISHRYERTDVPTMLDIVEDDLPPMITAIRAYLEAHP